MGEFAVWRKVCQGKDDTVYDNHITTRERVLRRGRRAHFNNEGQGHGPAAFPLVLSLYQHQSVSRYTLRHTEKGNACLWCFIYSCLVLLCILWMQEKLIVTNYATESWSFRKALNSARFSCRECFCNWVMSFLSFRELQSIISHTLPSLPKLKC